MFGLADEVFVTRFNWNLVSEQTHGAHQLGRAPEKNSKKKQTNAKRIAGKKPTPKKKAPKKKLALKKRSLKKGTHKRVGCCP